MKKNMKENVDFEVMMTEAGDFIVYISHCLKCNKKKRSNVYDENYVCLRCKFKRLTKQLKEKYGNK